MTLHHSTALTLPTYGWPVSMVLVGLAARVAANAAKRNYFPTRGCFPMTD